jgi:hypothetical protein
MRTGFHKCLGENCNKTITWSFALCSDCEKKYGRSSKDWPEWLSFLWKDILRSRRQNIRIFLNEVPVDPDDMLEVKDGRPSEYE